MWLAVATAAEAAELRGAGIDARLLVMGALTPDDVRTALLADADVVAWTPELVAALPDSAGSERPRVHVKLDSGMGRLGTRDPAEVRELCRTIAADPRLELAGLMTHFATADEPGDEYFPAQLARFRELVDELRGEHPGLIVHAANSAATFREPAAHFDMVRCGVAIYGLDPFGEDPAARGLEPALALESYVAAVKRFEAGDGAGYGQTWRAEAPTCVGVLPIGYGDGWRRSLSGNARVLVRGRPRPLVGTVSMDNVTVDLGPDTDVEPGDRAVLIGEQDGERILAEEVAGRIGTINYEVTCGLTPRVRRAHRRGR
ncbi:MAG: alanine racemase [Thermoleophilaceae bacterium]|nr:alanine racemase [Thermoleophilaceae bacterium]